MSIGVRGGRCFGLVADLLQKALNLYKTEDVLLKMAMAQVIAKLGEGQETSKLLREHSIWKQVEQEACVHSLLSKDPQQEFYVKKFLLLLLVDMFNNGHYDMGAKVVKHLH